MLGTILRPCSWPMPTLPPWPTDALLLALLELAQEINGTAAQLAQLAERFTTEAAAA